MAKTAGMARNKYNAIKVTADGRTFASQLEYRRYCELKLLQRRGLIEGLECQPKFNAIVNGEHVCNIIPDFRYYCKVENKLIYEDAKGCITPIFRLKNKLLKALYPEVDLRLIYDAR